jgi:hypothetical protein
MRNVLILCLTAASLSASAGSRERVEHPSGLIVAYTVNPACLNRNWYWEMIIRVGPHRNASAEFIEVYFSLPCDKSPEWLLTKQSIRKFRLVREKECESELREFSLVQDQSSGDKPRPDPDMPVWHYPPGAPEVKLPYGQVLRCYRSLDLSLLPVL